MKQFLSVLPKILILLTIGLVIDSLVVMYLFATYVHVFGVAWSVTWAQAGFGGLLLNVFVTTSTFLPQSVSAAARITLAMGTMIDKDKPTVAPLNATTELASLWNMVRLQLVIVCFFLNMLV